MKLVMNKEELILIKLALLLLAEKCEVESVKKECHELIRKIEVEIEEVLK